MQKILITLACAAMTLGAAAQQTVNIGQLSQYCYPANKQKSASLRFMPDGLSYLKISDNGKAIERYEVATGKLLETVMDVTNTRGDAKIESIADFIVSDNGTKILVYEESTPIYRHSFSAKWMIYETHGRVLKQLSTAHPIQQSPVISPDSRMVAFMAEDNNIYVHKIDYGSEVPVTTDGKVNAIINGVPDWTYQEEFATTCSMAWAPDNSMLCYIRYDETDVPAYSFPLYQGACDPMDQYALYPGQFTCKYPVAGEPNSRVSIHSYDVETRKIKDLPLPGKDIEYVPRINFGPEASQLMVCALNRDQNRLDIYRVNPRSAVAESIYQEKSNAWILPGCYEDIVYEPKGMVIKSDRTGYTHLYRVGYNGTDMGALTSGDYDVTAYYGSASDGSYYYQSAEKGPLNRVITKVDAKGKHTMVSPAEGWSSAQFAKAMNHYILCHSTTTQPNLYTLMGKDKSIRTLEENAEIASRYASVPQKEFFTMQSGGEELNGWMIKPQGFDASKKYPAIIYQYSGPGSQEVMNRWSIDWAQYFAMQGYVIACVDGRGTGARGRKFEQIVYKNLGYYETIDQNALLSHLQSLSYIDGKRIGIYGWSYGGYETLMAASSGAGYAAAVAVAPVTSWRYYDTVYAERYMTTPKQNEQGYDRSAPINRVEKLTCPLLMISGTADDNVHMSNTIEFTSRLIALNRWPDMLLFPNMNHSINGCNTRAVVYGRMLEFFNKNIGNK